MKSTDLIPQWLRSGQDMEHHDISHGLRENWNAKRKWKMAISGVQAAIRMKHAAGSTSGPSSQRASVEQARPSVVKENVRSSGEYDTATEDEAGKTDDEGVGMMTRKRSTSLIQKKTTDETAKRVSTELRKDLNGKMAQLQRKAEELQVKEG